MPKRSSERSRSTRASAPRSSPGSSEATRTQIPSAAELKRLTQYVALLEKQNRLLAQQVQLRERLRAPSPRPSPGSRRTKPVTISAPGRGPTRTKRPSKARARFEALHPRDSKGRWISKTHPPVTERPREPTGEFAPVQPTLPLNWETKVKIVTDRSTEDHLDYSTDSVWIVTDYDPSAPANQDRFGEYVQAIRHQLKKEDPHVRWLSIHGVHRTTHPTGTRIEEEPRPPGE